MSNIIFFPPLPERGHLFDQLFRTVWHFLPALEKVDRFIFPYGGSDLPLFDVQQVLTMADVYISRDFDPAIATHAVKYQGKIEFVGESSIDPSKYDTARIGPLRGVLVWDVGDERVVSAARKIAEQTGAEIIWADPSAVHQETLGIIRFAYDFCAQSELEALVQKSYDTFKRYLEKWSGQTVSSFGNGPSLGRVVQSQEPVRGALRTVCNSTIGDDDALDYLRPEILFCGDPVQHCGPSLYAGKFRQDLARAMEDPSRVVITQLGYVPYFRESIPSHAHDRIVGIGNDRRATFNIDLTKEFLTASTANIFTMLVLPVAFTISNKVDVYGCDGMSFAAATKPWSHTKEDDYMGKMAVTHRVHPAFWRRNYEEEFWSYCNDMEDIICAAESRNIKVRSRTPSHVPALAKRYASQIRK